MRKLNVFKKNLINFLFILSISSFAYVFSMQEDNKSNKEDYCSPEMKEHVIPRKRPSFFSPPYDSQNDDELISSGSENLNDTQDDDEVSTDWDDTDFASECDCSDIYDANQVYYVPDVQLGCRSFRPSNSAFSCSPSRHENCLRIHTPDGLLKHKDVVDRPKLVSWMPNDTIMVLLRNGKIQIVDVSDLLGRASHE